MIDLLNFTIEGFNNCAMMRCTIAESTKFRLTYFLYNG